MTSSRSRPPRLSSSLICLAWIMSMGFTIAYCEDVEPSKSDVREELKLMNDIDKKIELQKIELSKRSAKSDPIKSVSIEAERMAMLEELEKLHDEVKKRKSVKLKSLPKEMWRDGYIPERKGDGTILLRSWIERRSRRNSQQGKKGNEGRKRKSRSRAKVAVSSGAR